MRWYGGKYDSFKALDIISRRNCVVKVQIADFLPRKKKYFPFTLYYDISYDKKSGCNLIIIIFYAIEFLYDFLIAIADSLTYQTGYYYGAGYS